MAIAEKVCMHHHSSPKLRWALLEAPARRERPRLGSDAGGRADTTDPGNLPFWGVILIPAQCRSLQISIGGPAMQLYPSPAPPRSGWTSSFRGP